MKNKKAVAALVAVVFWMGASLISAGIVRATGQDALIDNGSVPSLIVEDRATPYSLMRLSGNSASHSLYVTITGAGLATNTIIIAPITTFATAGTTIATGTAGTFTPSSAASSFILSSAATQTMQFMINGTATANSPYFPAGSIIAWGDDMQVTSISVWNSGTVPADTRVLFGFK